jgi:hypothetical protein
MINKAEIQGNLTQLYTLYKRARTPKKSSFYSKLAILELCGWIEESMDDIANCCAARHLRESENLKVVKRAIKSIHSFDYDSNFREMLISVIGIINVEKLEMSLDQRKFQQMKASLHSLKERRDPQAHTHLVGTTSILDAPSVTYSRFLEVYHGLKDIETCLRKTGL